MSTAYISQIEMFGFNFAPKNWALCQGQTLSIQQNQALFSLVGTTYGGDGITTFKLPDLRSRVPSSQGQGPGLPNFNIGQVAGEETHALAINEMPQHSHFLQADAVTTTGLTEVPSASLALGQSTGKPATGANFTLNIYGTTSPAALLAPQAIGNAGSGTAHENRMPYMTLNFCICLSGLFPSRN